MKPLVESAYWWHDVGGLLDRSGVIYDLLYRIRYLLHDCLNDGNRVGSYRDFLFVGVGAVAV